jgi:nucleolar GTP-binding protein
MTGLPNVGKSSFMNKITRGNVDVQPYAFTTKSLFVGHCDYKYLRWQVIDTPGILDHSLEERNTIEMQAIIALAHLTCSVLYFCDISEHCGYPIEQQVSLFESIKPLFANKELIIVVNKVDEQPWETLDAEKKEMIEAMAKDANCSLMTMSNVSEHGVSEVKAAACEKLLASRVDARVAGKKIDTVMNRLQVFHPTPRDNVERTAHIPDSVQEAIRDGRLGSADHKPKRSRTGYAQTINDVNDSDDDDDDMINGPYRKTARDLMWENGGPGVWAPDYREQYDLKDSEWKFDAIPEIMDGKNIADYIDPEIERKLAELEAEEEQLVSELEAQQMGEEPESDLDSEEEAAVEAIRERKKLIKQASHRNKSENKPVIPRVMRGRAKDKHDSGARNENVVRETMSKLGVDASKMIERGRSLERERGRKRERSRARGMDVVGDDKEGGSLSDTEMEDKSMSKTQVKKQKRSKSEAAKREASITRGHSRPRDPSQVGLHTEEAVTVAKKLERQGRKGWLGASGEGDNRKAVHLVKWMNTGKKRNGTHYCR